MTAIEMLQRIRNEHDCPDTNAESLGDFVGVWMPRIREIISHEADLLAECQRVGPSEIIPDGEIPPTTDPRF